MRIILSIYNYGTTIYKQIHTNILSFTHLLTSTFSLHLNTHCQPHNTKQNQTHQKKHKYSIRLLPPPPKLITTATPRRRLNATVTPTPSPPLDSTCRGYSFRVLFSQTIYFSSFYFLDRYVACIDLSFL